MCQAAESAAALAKSLQDAGLDTQECYRVRDLSFQKEDLKFYLTEGHLIFSRPVEGRRFAAAFITDVPGGDGEILVFPPHRSDRLSLSSFAKTPNLNEHIDTAIFIFSDGAGEELLDQLRASEAKRVPEAALLIEQPLAPVLKNLTASWETRLVHDYLANRQEGGFFYAAVRGRNLGNFDLLYDTRASEQILIGQVAFRNDRRYWDTWASFRARSYRTGRKEPVGDPISVSAVTIDATIDPLLHITATTRVTLTTSAATNRALSFDISRRMRVKEARVDGKPAEVFARESLRSNLIKGGENDSFLIVLPEGLSPGDPHTVELVHEGDVILRSGNGVFYVGARNSWYPNRDTSFAKYDVTFRYPKNLSLVATGEVTEDRVDGEWRVSRRITPLIRFAGFNLGEYEKLAVQRAGFTVEVYANRRVEAALQPRESAIVIPPPPQVFGRQNRRFEVPAIPLSTPILSPTARLQQLATEISSAMEFMSAHFGPPPLKTLTVSPIPGAFGQGFPGLIYLSTLTYLNPADRPASMRTGQQRTFFSELLHAHETAHQWWGNLVTTAGYQDEWLMEALASYSALMFLERRKGRDAMLEVLDQYRDDLLKKNEDGRTLESAGPIVWGIRLNSSLTPGSWRTIVYEKGSWIVHMLRSRMGDAQFLKMLGEVVRRNRYSPLTTDGFRRIASEFLPPNADDPKLESFFEQWVYGTGIPTLKLAHNVQGKAPKIRVRANVDQSGVEEDFSALVPIELQLPGKRNLTRWIRTSSEPVTVTVELSAAPARVVLNPGNAVLAARD